MKERIKKWIIGNKYTLLFLLLLLFTSSASIAYILQTAVPEFDGSKFYEDVEKYDFKVVAAQTEETPTVEEDSGKARISWNMLSGFFYVSSFDGGVSAPPSSAYEDLAAIPGGAKEIQLDISLQGEYITDTQNEYDVYLYLITYNSKGQVDKTYIRPDFQNRRERHRNFTLTVDVSDDAQYFKVLLRVSSRAAVSKDGYIDISMLDITFR